jgi:hypothetical protein
LPLVLTNCQGWKPNPKLSAFVVQLGCLTGDCFKQSPLRFLDDHDCSASADPFYPVNCGKATARIER